MSVSSQDLDFHCYMSWSFFMFNELKWEVIVCFVDIGRIVDHYCLTSFWYCFLASLLHLFCFSFICMFFVLCKQNNDISSQKQLCIHYSILFLYRLRNYMHVFVHCSCICQEPVALLYTCTCLNGNYEMIINRSPK